MEQVVCERLPANAPHWHVSVCVNHRCLFLPLSGLLQTSHGSLPVSLPGASAAQVTQGGMTSMPLIHQAARSSRREQTELNLGSYYSVQADCTKLCRNLVAFIFHQKFSMITYFLVALSPSDILERFLCIIHNILIFHLMFEIHHVMAYPGWVGMWRVISPLWHLPSAILTSSTSQRCRRPCSSVWCPLTQTPLHFAHTSTNAHRYRFTANRVIWCELTASHDSNQ